jgi:hypothetical protein
MAVANIGVFLARMHRARQQRVLMIDWDLEAPGLYAYFAEESDPEAGKQAGLIEYFESLRSAVENDPELYRRVARGQATPDSVAPLSPFVMRDVLPGLDLMNAGLLDGTYYQRVSGFDWAGLWDRRPALFRAFRDQLSSQYAVCLIDSRTGYNDTSGICTAVMPEKLVPVFTLNRQSCEGTIRIVEESVRFRMRSDDIRPLAVFPLASRVENGELKERENWLLRFERAFEASFRSVYDLEFCDLREYFRDVLIPYVPYFAYGEKLVSLVEESRVFSLRRALEDFGQRLMDFDYAWQSPEEAKRNREVDAELATQPSTEEDTQ